LISVVANAYPKDYSDMVRLCLTGKFTDAQKLHYKYTDIIASMFAEGSPSGVKAFLSEMGLCKNTFRLPVWPMSEKHHQKIKELMKAIE
jgi:4-hydroxy-tetrahydrodipicolinate synthase